MCGIVRPICQVILITISYCIYFERARGEYLNSLGFFNSQVTAVTADLWCHYHREAFFPSKLQAGVRVSELGNRSMELEYFIMSDDQSIIITVLGTLVFLDKKV